MKKIIYPVIYIALTFLILSCQSQEDGSLKDTFSSLKNTPTATIMINSSNHLDSIGFYHNKGLEYFAQNYDGVSDIEQASSYLTKTFVCSQNMQFLGQISNCQSVVNTQIPTSSFSDFSSAGQSFLNSLTNLSVTSNSIKGIDYFQNQVISLENQVLSSSISTIEKDAILVGCAITRYSVVYWFNNLNDTSSFWSNTQKCDLCDELNLRYKADRDHGTLAWRSARVAGYGYINSGYIAVTRAIHASIII